MTPPGCVLHHDVLAIDGERLAGRPLLEPAMRSGRPLLRDSLDDLRARARCELSALPEQLRRPHGPPGEPYAVTPSEKLAELAARVQGIEGPERVARMRRPLQQHGVT